jgi:site-specific recombinase XerD
MIEDMQLRGLAERTREAYVLAVRQLAKYYMRAPDQLTEEEVRRYFLHLMNIGQAPATIRLRLHGIRFLYETTLGRHWPQLQQIRIKLPKRLPTVLNRSEVVQLLRGVKRPKLRMALTLIYSCGLRLSEAVLMREGQVDLERLLVHVHGKGSKDRCVPLPSRTAELLSEYWAWVQPRSSSPYLFAGKARGTVCKTTVQRAVSRVVKQSQLGKRVTVSDGGTRRPLGALSRLRHPTSRLPLLRQSLLSQLSGGPRPTVGLTTPCRAAAHPLLPSRPHPTHPTPAAGAKPPACPAEPAHDHRGAGHHGPRL